MPPPIHETIEVISQLELNEIETIWMFRYHTWRGYPGGMNLEFPGAQNYKIGGLVGGHIGGRITGRKMVDSGELDRIRQLAQTKEAQRLNGKRNVENGHLSRIINQEIRRRGGRTSGNNNVISGHLAKIRTPEHQKAAGRIAGRKAVESGQIQKLARDQIHAQKLNRTGIYAPGVCSAGGRKAVENKLGIHATGFDLSKAGRKGGSIGGRLGAPIMNHNRWHLARGISRPDICKLCRGAND